MSELDTHSIEARLTALNQRIERACAACGRSPQEVTLVGVSKTKPAKDVAMAHALGLANFGENYIQEAGDKIQALKQIEATWHFIGSIQSNKTQDVAQHFDWVHTVDREKIGKRLSAQCPSNKVLNVLVQVNIDDDPAKGGCSAAELPNLVNQLTSLPNLQVRGLMTILSKASEPRASYQSVAQLSHGVRQALSEANKPLWDSLSMGMTGDLEHAIAAGATHIRIGTALFGERALPDQ